MNPVTDIGQTGGTANTGPRRDTPAKIRDAAQQFEALLLGQILHTVRESGSGWLGSGGEGGGDCATDFAEQQLASALAQRGGLGLAGLIAAGLTPRSQAGETAGDSSQT